MPLNYKANLLPEGFFSARFTALVAALAVLSAPTEVQAGGPLISLFASAHPGAASLTFDGHGNLFMSNVTDNTISKITPAGDVSTFATGLGSPEALAFDSHGDLYVVNTSKNSVSKITPDGHVADFAAVNERVSACPAAFTTYPCSVAPSFGSASSVLSPSGLAFDRDGALYVSAPDANVIDSIAPNGTVTHFVVGPQASSLLPAREGGLYAAGRNGITRIMPNGQTSVLVNVPLLDWPNVLGFDAGDNLYVADRTKITKTTPDGRIKLFASLSCSTSLVFDRDGNLYCSSGPSDDKLFKIAPDGHVETVATTLVSPSGIAFDARGQIYVGDNYAHSISTLTSAGQTRIFASGCRCDSAAVVFDQRGNFYFADNESGTIDKVTPDGRVTVFLSGVGGVDGMAFDGGGSLYLSHSSDNTISKVTPDGKISVFANNGLDYPVPLVFDHSGTLYVGNRTGISRVAPDGRVSAFVSDGIYDPTSLVFDRDGNLYVASFNNSLFEVSPDGKMRQLAGFKDPQSLAFDRDGNLWAYGNVLSKMTPDGKVTDIASGQYFTIAGDGNGLLYFEGNGVIDKIGADEKISPLVTSPIYKPESIAFDRSGNLFVANGNNTIGKVAPDGTATVFLSGCCGSNVGSTQLAFDQHDNLYLADFDHGMIRKITPDGKAADFFAIPFPQGLAVNSHGDIYATTQANKDGASPRIIKINSSGGASTIETVEIDNPADMAQDRAGNLYVANNRENTISKIAPDGSLSRFLTGLIEPRGIAFDDAGDRYVADSGNNRIVKITPNGAVSVFAAVDNPAGLVADGSGGFYVALSRRNVVVRLLPDGTSRIFATGLSAPRGLVRDGAGNLYVANSAAGTVGKIAPDGHVATFASGLTKPRDLAIDAAGNLYVVGAGTNTVSKITPAGSVSAVTVKFDLQAPQGIAVDQTGSLYVGQHFGALLKILPDGTASIYSKPPNNVTTLVFAPDGDLHAAMDDDSIWKVTPDGNQSRIYTGLAGPVGLAIDSSDNLFVSNILDGTIGRVPLGGSP